MSWSDLEHSVWKNLKIGGLEAKENYFLCVSGGLDSMVLLQVMRRLKPAAHLTVAYYHHGFCASQAQNEYRNGCKNLIEETCSRLDPEKIHFITDQSSNELHSEAQFRDARWYFFKKHRLLEQPIITAHHLDDWVETLTLKLIRGVGAEGFTAMKIWDENIFRPFLETPKKDLIEYAKYNDLIWLEDPSNDSNQYLRNWLRHDWFKSLDEKNPSGYENYSRSLLRLCQELDRNQTFALCFYSNNIQFGLDRPWYISLSEKQQMKALALYLRSHSILNTTQGQIAETQKRLDNIQKDITFSIGPIKWLINSHQIMLQF